MGIESRMGRSAIGTAGLIVVEEATRRGILFVKHRIEESRKEQEEHAEEIRATNLQSLNSGDGGFIPGSDGAEIILLPQKRINLVTDPPYILL